MFGFWASNISMTFLVRMSRSGEPHQVIFSWTGPEGPSVDEAPPAPPAPLLLPPAPAELPPEPPRAEPAAPPLPPALPPRPPTGGASVLEQPPATASEESK